MWVRGVVGRGKTTLCRTLLERLDGDTELAFLFNPSRTALELLQSICAEFDLPAEGLTRRSLMTQLDAFLVEKKRQGHRVLLIVDEAQTLSDNTLEQVRLLSNLETSREKLIQILLLGQPELDRKLDGQGLRQLRQRISVRWKLEPLGPQETRAYVRHRLAIAAGEPKDLFSEAALREIHRRTGGIPRLVNQLCDRALLGGYAARAAQIRPSQVRAAAREIPDTRRGRGRKLNPEARSLMRPWLYLATTVGLVTLALMAGLAVGRNGLLGARAGDLRSTLEMGRPATPPAVGANAAAPIDGARAIGFNPGDSVVGFVAPPRQGALPAGGLGTGRVVPQADPVRSADLTDPVDPVESDVIALTPGLLRRLLATRNAELAMADGQRAVLESFGRSPAPTRPTDVASLQKGIEHGGLVATPFDGGSIDLLRRLDHPVLLPLVPEPNPASRNPEAGLRQSETRWIEITGFIGNRARIDGLMADRSVTIPIEELSTHWLETGIIVWDRFDVVSEFLARGQSGHSVRWLQNALVELRYLEAQPSGAFDAKTFKALADFQRANGLIADGIAGPLTQIALYAQMDRYPIPRLSRADATAATGARGDRG
jgi:general secretion pathway protein A